jgi:predicted transporter
VFFLGLAVFVWMVLEARRLGMRGVWLYLLFGMLVAISVTVPIFLINRERALAAREPSSAAGTLGTLDVIGLVLVTVAILAYAAMALLRG